MMQLNPPKVNRASGRKTGRDRELVSFEIKASCCNPPPISIRELRIAERNKE